MILPRRSSLIALVKALVLGMSRSRRAQSSLLGQPLGCRMLALECRTGAALGDRQYARRTCSMQAQRRAGLSSFPGPPPAGSACRASDPTPPDEASGSPSQGPSDASPDRSSAAKLLPPAIVRHLAHADRIASGGSRAPRSGRASHRDWALLRCFAFDHITTAIVGPNSPSPDSSSFVDVRFGSRSGPRGPAWLCLLRVRRGRCEVLEGSSPSPRTVTGSRL